MQTLRISTVEVQVGVIVYQFPSADVADGFYALARQNVDASLIESRCLALCIRPADYDHEPGNWQE